MALPKSTSMDGCNNNVFFFVKEKSWFLSHNISVPVLDVELPRRMTLGKLVTPAALYFSHL